MKSVWWSDIPPLPGFPESRFGALAYVFDVWQDYSLHQWPSVSMRSRVLQDFSQREGNGFHARPRKSVRCFETRAIPFAY